MGVRPSGPHVDTYIENATIFKVRALPVIFTSVCLLISDLIGLENCDVTPVNFHRPNATKSCCHCIT